MTFEQHRKLGRWDIAITFKAVSQKFLFSVTSAETGALREPQSSHARVSKFTKSFLTLKFKAKISKECCAMQVKISEFLVCNELIFGFDSVKRPEHWWLPCLWPNIKHLETLLRAFPSQGESQFIAHNGQWTLVFCISTFLIAHIGALYMMMPYN